MSGRRTLFVLLAILTASCETERRMPEPDGVTADYGMPRDGRRVLGPGEWYLDQDSIVRPKPPCDCAEESRRHAEMVAEVARRALGYDSTSVTIVPASIVAVRLRCNCGPDGCGGPCYRDTIRFQVAIR